MAIVVDGGDRRAIADIGSGAAVGGLYRFDERRTVRGGKSFAVLSGSGRGEATVVLYRCPELTSFELLYDEEPVEPVRMPIGAGNDRCSFEYMPAYPVEATADDADQTEGSGVSEWFQCEWTTLALPPLFGAFGLTESMGAPVQTPGQPPVKSICPHFQRSVGNVRTVADFDLFRAEFKHEHLVSLLLVSVNISRFATFPV